MTSRSKDGEGEKSEGGRNRERRRVSKETRAPRTRTLVVVPAWKRQPKPKTAQLTKSSTHIHTPENRLAEAVGLARAIELDIIDSTIVPVSEPRPATLLGSGKVEEIKGLVEELEIGLVVIDYNITPVQQRNLEKAWNAKVLDRTGLILEIFGARARTREGVLQVELAHLTYQRAVSFAPGPIWNASAAAAASSAAPAKPRSNSIAECSRTASMRSKTT